MGTFSITLTISPYSVLPIKFEPIIYVTIFFLISEFQNQSEHNVVFLLNQQCLLNLSIHKYYAMTKIQYTKPKNFRKDTVLLLEKIVKVVDDYQEQGYRITLRQLFYQLVTKNILENKESQYKKLSTLLKDARMSGLIDLDVIEDRIRVPTMPSSRFSYIVSRLTLGALSVGLSLPAAIFGNEYFSGIPELDVIIAGGIGFVTYRSQDFKKLYKGDKSKNDS